MAFSCFEYLLSYQRYSSFCSKIDDVTNSFSTKDLSYFLPLIAVKIYQCVSVTLENMLLFRH